MELASSTTAPQQSVFELFERYDFDHDPTFQSGLKSIVANNQTKSAQEQEEAIKNARYFYFSRFVQNFDLKEYQAWAAQRSGSTGETSTSSSTQGQSQAQENNEATASDTTTSTADPSYPKSFQEICELIASGKPIPGIRQIPNNLAEGTPSEAKLAPKPKPWEKKAAATAQE
ncbi:hypothetical protein EMPS_01650 [Entomortierella parvispora]|uniref:Uncharacterized protein n=1 Tax=Entomortierella parvispora TaxID=205924 RepID=A0A9P3H3C7_9FUNG|nr:hypothetical protein EMPS_01650 [Entomortierella parvispora]